MANNKEKKSQTLKIQRVVRYFQKDGDKLLGEIPLDNVELLLLQKLFGESQDNPMYDCYPIKTSHQIEYLEKITQSNLDTQSYDYFLECHAV